MPAMEPLSIASAALSTANTAYKVGTALYEFIQSTKEVDETVRSLCSGVKQVENVCHLIEKQVRLLPEPQKDESDHEDLYEGIDSQLSECLAVIYKVNSKLDPVRDKKSGGLKQAYRQWRLNLSQADINECRLQISNGVQNLQLSLQLVSLQAIYLAPKVANQALLDKIDEIQNLLTSETVDRRLQVCANAYITKGTSLYASSVASSMGTYQTPFRPKEVANWLDQLEQLQSKPVAALDTTTRDDELHASTLQLGSAVSLDAVSSTRAYSIVSLQTTRPGPTTDTSPTRAAGDSILALMRRATEVVSDRIEPGSDDVEDEFVADMVQAALSSGKDAFCQRDYAKAELMFKECLDLLQKLPENWRGLHDFDYIHLHLAFCAFRIHDLQSAEAALLSALVRETELHASTNFAVGFALSVVYYQQGKYDLARITCQNVYQSRRRLIGKDHELSYDALALLACIYECQGQQARAATIQAMIDPDRRDVLLEKYRRLQEEKDNSEKYAPATINEPLHSKTDAELNVQTPKQMQNPVWSTSRSWQEKCYTAMRPESNLIALSELVVLRRSPDSTIELIDFSTGYTVQVLRIVGDTATQAFDFDRSGSIIASGHGGYWYVSRRRSKIYFKPLSIHIWNIRTGRKSMTLPIEIDQRNMRIGFDGLRFCANDERLVLSYSYDDLNPSQAGEILPGIMVIDAKTGQKQYRLICGSCKFQMDIYNSMRVDIWAYTEVHKLDMANIPFVRKRMKIREATWVLPNTMNGTIILVNNHRIVRWYVEEGAYAMMLDLSTVWGPDFQLRDGMMQLSSQNKDVWCILSSPDNSALYLTDISNGRKIVIHISSRQSRFCSWNVCPAMRYLLCCEMSRAGVESTKIFKYDLEEQPYTTFDNSEYMALIRE